METPRPFRISRQWGFPACYCAAISCITAASLIIRPFVPHATGGANGGEARNGFAECWLLAAAVLVPVVVALVMPVTGAFFLVLMTAFARVLDAVHPLSIVPFAWYALLLVAQWMIFLGGSPAKLAAWWERRHGP